MLRKLYLFSIEQTFIVCLFILEAYAIQSRWGYTFNKTTDKQYSIFPNYLYKGASVTVTIMCYSKDKDVHVNVDWLLQEVDCMEQIYKVDMESDLAVFRILNTVSGVNGTKTWNSSEKVHPDNNLKKRKVAFQRSKGSSYPCQMNNVVTLQDESEDPYYIGLFPKNMNIKDIPFEEIEIKKKEKIGTAGKKNKMISHEVTRAWEDGMYHMLLSISATDPKKDFEATAIVEMHGRYGFLSAIDWPLLPYNSVMAFLYLILATVWIIIWARSHKHTLKIHVVMGFIAVAGAMCHTLQFIEHAAVNSNGGGVKGLLWFARVLVSAQISVLYLILMIVSTGYGITRPKLSKTYIIPISALAGLNFILDSMWKISVDESLKIQYEYPFFTKCLLWMKTAMLLIITGWILIAAISTFVHLCHRRHSSTRLVVFSMYTATIAVVFVSNLVMFGISMGWMHACRKNWQLEWIFSSFSSMGSFVLLIVLMWLWRPVDTAQSYAFAPLGDADDDEMDEFLADDDEDSDVEEFNMEKTKIKLGMV